MPQFNRKSSSIINLRMFHNWVKNELYIETSKKLEGTIKILELAVGRAGDLYKWIGIEATEVIGIDIDNNSIFGKNGALHRYKKMKNRAKNDSSLTLPNCWFHAIDLSKGENLPKIDNILKGKTFNIISCQFAIHYFFESQASFYNIVSIIAKYIEKDGYFIGTTLDGDKVRDLFLEGDVVKRKMFAFKNVTKPNQEYDPYGNSYLVRLGEKDEDHYFSEKDSLEYMVDFKEFKRVLKTFGLDYVKSTSFDKLYETYLKNKPKYKMSEDEKEFSFLNFSFMFVKST